MLCCGCGCGCVVTAAIRVVKRCVNRFIGEYGWCAEVCTLLLCEHCSCVCVCVCVLCSLSPQLPPSSHPRITPLSSSYIPPYIFFNRVAKRSPEATANGETQGVLVPAIMTCVKLRNNLLTPINNLINTYYHLKRPNKHR